MASVSVADLQQKATARLRPWSWKSTPGFGFSNSTRLAMSKSISTPNFDKIAQSTAVFLSLVPLVVNQHAKFEVSGSNRQVTIGSEVSEGAWVEFPTFPLTCIVVLKTFWHYCATV